MKIQLIDIRDGANQKQDVNDLSRDTEHAANGLSPIFNKEKEQQRLQQAQLIGEIGNQVADVIRTQGKLAGEKAKSDPKALATAEAELRAEATAKGKVYTGSSASEIADRAYLDAEKAYGTGSDLQRGVAAATAAITALAGGDIGKALAGASAPYVAEVIHNATTDPVTGKVNQEANLMAHAVLGAVVAKVNGNGALAGASGAALGEYIAQQLYPDIPRDKLTEEQRQTTSTLGTLAAGLAGGITGDSSANAVAGAQAGKNALENNALGAMAGSDLGFWLAQTPDCDTECKGKLAGDVATGNAVVSAHLAGTIGLGVLPKGALVTAVIGGGANTIIQYVVNGEVNYTDALIASWVGAATSNTGLLGTIGWNAAGGATSNAIKGDDPLTGAITSGAASGIGFGIGKVIQGPMDKLINPNWKNWQWVDVGMGISKPMPLDPRPAVIGNIISSGSSEGINQGGSKSADSSKEGGEVMRNFFRLIITILLVILAVTSGMFISRILFYVIETRDFNIPFIEILKVSFKAGLAGGVIGGIGMYFIPYFFSKTPRQ